MRAILGTFFRSFNRKAVGLVNYYNRRPGKVDCTGKREKELTIKASTPNCFFEEKSKPGEKPCVKPYT